MGIACLARISPLNPATGARVAIHVASANDRAITGLGGQVWEPAIITPPQLGIALWNGDFIAAVEPAQASIVLAMATVGQTYAGADGYIWAGAPLAIFAGDTADPWPWAQYFAGRVKNYSSRGRTLTLSAEADSEPFDKTVLTATFAGTGGAEGDDNLKNQVKPLVLGWAQNVQPVLINTVSSVYQFSGYGGIEAVTALYERGSAFGAAFADYATYTALVAATIPPGAWATCLASGMVRLGAPEFGVITGDVKGHKLGGTTPRLTGAVILALAAIAGVSEDLIETASLTALDGAKPYPINLVITDQITFLDLARTLALACNWQAGLSLLGTFFAVEIALSGSEVLNLDVQGRQLPLVTGSEEQEVSPPYYQTTLGAARSWRVHTSEEIASTVAPIDRGRYAPGETYREANIVDLSDGSRWSYINQVAASGNAPPTWPTTANAWWTNLSPPSVPVSIDIVQAQVINADHTGAILTGQLPRNVDPSVVRGEVDIRAFDEVTYALADVGSTLGASVDTALGSATKGRVTLTTMTGTGTVSLRVTVAGVLQPPRTLTFTKVNAAPPVSTTSSGSIAGAGVMIASTSYIEVGRISNLAKAAGQTISAFLTAGYETGDYSGSGNTLSAKWQYSVAGAGSWTDFGAAITGSVSYFFAWEYGAGTVPGSVTCNQNAAPADGTYDVRLVALTDHTVTYGAVTTGPTFSSGGGFAATVSVA